mmetsp:Transcript_25397/g.52850  ORF Transcript_25397/g.52850 Transcript_25397/m.52850 type:complete len:258 (+) Transcript_25397:1463-2236(+)
MSKRKMSWKIMVFSSSWKSSKKWSWLDARLVTKSFARRLKPRLKSRPRKPRFAEHEKERMTKQRKLRKKPDVRKRKKNEKSKKHSSVRKKRLGEKKRPRSKPTAKLSNGEWTKKMNVEELRRAEDLQEEGEPVLHGGNMFRRLNEEPLEEAAEADLEIVMAPADSAEAGINTQEVDDTKAVEVAEAASMTEEAAVTTVVMVAVIEMEAAVMIAVRHLVETLAGAIRCPGPLILLGVALSFRSCSELKIGALVSRTAK